MQESRRTIAVTAGLTAAILGAALALRNSGSGKPSPAETRTGTLIARSQPAETRTGTLIARSQTPTVQQLAPYPRALAVFTYVNDDTGDRFRVAHWTVKESVRRPYADAATGSVHTICVAPLDDHAKLASERILDDTDLLDASPVFFDTCDYAGSYTGPVSALPNPPAPQPTYESALPLMVPDTDRLERLRDLLDRPARMVWCRSRGRQSALRGVADDRWPVLPNGPYFALIGLDTTTGQERVIVPGPRGVCGPLFTHDGERILFSDWPGKAVRVVNWDGTNLRTVWTSERYPVALGTWHDRATGRQWVYVTETESVEVSTSGVFRIDIDAPVPVPEPVWSETPVAPWNAWTFSRDGTRVGGAFPWPKVAVASLADRTFIQEHKGCGLNIAPDDSGRFFFYNAGNHRRIRICNADGSAIADLSVAESRGMAVAPWDKEQRVGETWLPRWSNDPRFFTITGPTTGTHLAGWPNVHIGRFAPDFKSIEAWVRVSNEPYCEAMADLWVAPDPAGQPLRDCPERGQSADSATRRR